MTGSSPGSSSASLQDQTGEVDLKSLSDLIGMLKMLKTLKFRKHGGPMEDMMESQPGSLLHLAIFFRPRLGKTPFRLIPRFMAA